MESTAAPVFIKSKPLTKLKPGGPANPMKDDTSHVFTSEVKITLCVLHKLIPSQSR